MANLEHLSILHSGPRKWNEWRHNNPDIKPDLSGADIHGMYLESVNFEGTDLSGANLSGCMLRWARFMRAIIDNTNLSGVDAVGTALDSILKQQRLENTRKREEERRKEKLSKFSKLALARYNESIDPESISPKIELIRQNLSGSYRESIENSLRQFTENGNDIVCSGFFVFEYGCCQLCGHSPIKWHYVLRNLQTKAQIHVGSQCISNFQIILSEWKYQPEYVVFPKGLRNFASWILEANPRSIIFDDDIASFIDKDCKEFLETIKDDPRLLSYGYVKRAPEGGLERVCLSSKNSSTKFIAW